MKKTFATKTMLAILVILSLLVSTSILASAATSFQNYKLAYGEIVPTDEDLKAQKSSYTFYGDTATIYFMRISEGTANSHYAVELFSDSDYKNQIRRFTKAYEAAGSSPFKINWPLGSETKSGTYYGRCYTYVVKGEVEIIDSASLKTFTIKINRVGKKAVELKSLKNTADGPKITWTKLPTADKYYVYRKAAGETSWTRLTILGAKYSSYTDTTAKSGVNYTYTVKCFDGSHVSLYNKTGLKTYFLACPKLSTVDGYSSAGYAKVNWTPVSGAEGYRVYRKGGSLSASQWELLAIVKGGKASSYIDKTATSTDWRYTYTVKAYYRSYTSAHNTDGVDFDYIPAPTLKKTSVTASGVKIEWSANNNNISHYVVYRKNGTSWERLGKTTAKAFTDTTAQSGKTYTYTVKAYSDTNAGAYNSKGITQKFLEAPVLSKLTFNSSKQSVVKWKQVPGASGYRVYRKTDNASGWTLISKIKNGKTTVMYDSVEKVSGSTYTYTVRAFDSKGLFSSFYSKGTSAMFLSEPEFTAQQLVTEDNSLAIEIKWQAVKGATKYNVYRRLPGGGWTILTGGTPEASFVDTTPECGVEYQYTVRAVNDAGNMSTYTVKSAMAVLIPTLDTVTVTEEGTKLTWAPTENAKLYTIYRKPATDGEWVAIGTSEAPEFTDASEEGKAQLSYYTVSATYGETESRTKAGLPNFVEIQINAEFVPATDEKAAHNKVSFNAEAAESVEVYKSVNGEAPVYLEGVTGDFEDTDIIEGYYYTYTVKALATGKLQSEASATVKYPHPPLVAPVISTILGDYNNGDPIIELSWGAVEFADEYVIYRAAGDGEFVEIATVKAEADEETNTPEDIEPVSDDNIFTYTDNDVSAEISYSYKIKAVATKSERDSSESEAVSEIIYTPLESVTGIKFDAVKNTKGKINVTISWDETKYAETYHIHRKATDGDWALVGVVIPGDNALTCNDTVDMNVEYTYKVTAKSVNRGEASNTETYCWAEETYLSYISENTYIYDGMLVTTSKECTNINAIATVKDGYTAELTNSHEGVVGTGSTLNIYKDAELVFTYTVVVKGDVNGDSVYDVLDKAEISKIIENISDYSDIQKLAADINGDGTVDATDRDLTIN